MLYLFFCTTVRETSTLRAEINPILRPLLLTTAVKVKRLDFSGMKLETPEFTIRRYLSILEEYLPTRN
jgi:hypothetical protein